METHLKPFEQRVELKRLEHERQRALHRQVFEQQMAALEQKQATQERAADSDHDNASENGSEADVESNAGSGVGESWISVKDE